MRGPGRGTAALALGALVVVTLITLLLGSDRTAPYDLDSAEPAGYRGLRLILQDLRVDMVERDLSDLDPGRLGATDVVYVPRPAGASPAARRRWTELAGDGHHVVIAGPAGAPAAQAVFPEGGGVAGGFPIVSTDPARCTDDRLADLGDLRVVGVPQLSTVGAERSCFGDDNGAYVVTRRIGRGDLTTIGSPDLFTNDLMRAHRYPVPEAQPDNSVVAVRLLAPAGTTRVVVVRGGAVTATEGGGSSAWELMSTGWRLALAQLGAAAALWIWWRAVRHGRVVAEPVPVSIAGSDLVDAVGDLHRRQGRSDLAARTVRSEVRRELCTLLGVDPYVEDRALASLVAVRTGRDVEEVLAALSRSEVGSDEALVAVARQLSSIRQEIQRV